MKKGLLTVVVALLLLAAAPCARADVIWEPYYDAFYPAHADECVYINRSFTAPAGVQGQESPEKDTVTHTFPAGSTLYISHSYTDSDGAQWGVWEEDGKSCWVRLEELQKVYDARDFLEEHQADLQPYSGEMKDYAVQQAVYLWSYPNSGAIDGKLTPEEASEEDAFQSIYTDDAGTRWAYVPYLYGMSGWVCVDDPENANLAAAASPEPTNPEATLTPGPTVAPVIAPISAKKEVAMLYWAIGAAALVVAVSALLIVRFYRKGKR